MSVRNLYPQQRPTLNLNFAQSKILDPRITFTRTSTATYVDEDGFIKTADNDVARFDHDPVTGECLGLLIEEGRTNYFHGTQTGSGGTVSDGTATGADGVIAKKFVPNAGNVSFPSINSRTNYSIPAGSQVNGATIDISFSGYISALASDLYTPDIVIQIDTGGSSNFAFAELLPNLSNGTVWSKGGIGVNGITELIAPQITLMPFGMYKITWSIRYTQGATIRNTVGFYLQCREKGVSSPSNTGTYVADGVNGFQYSCLQYEIGAFPTSFIPTTTSSVSRNPDNAYIEGTEFSKFYNLSEGTVFCSFSSPTPYGRTNATPFVFSINKNTIGWGHYVSSGGSSISLFRDPSNVNIAFLNTAGSPTVVTTDQIRKLSVGYKLDDFVQYVNVGNGIISERTDSLGQVRSNINTLDFNPQHSGLQCFGGHIQKFVYYPTKFTNTQIRNLAL